MTATNELLNDFVLVVSGFNHILVELCHSGQEQAGDRFVLLFSV